MSRARRLLVVAVAWAVPAVWVVAGLKAGPSDGTSVTDPLAPTGAGWGDTVRVARTFGETPLVPGDEVLAVDGRTLAEWVGGGAAGHGAGDVVRYEVRRSGPGLDRIQQVDVTLAPYDVAAALRAEPHVPLLSGLLLLVGSLVFWARPRSASARAYLAATALLPAIATSAPFGAGVVDLAGARGMWPHVLGEVLAVLGLVALVLSVAHLSESARRHRRVVAAAVVAPAAGTARGSASRSGERPRPRTGSRC